MAALVLGLAGSAIGGSAAVTGALGISTAMGASVGWAIGSMLGGMLGPKQKIEGPRLQDGKVQASTHGQAIPIIYGSFRTAGNIIDFSGMREHAKTERSKKAKSQVTTYSYECDVAVGICAGEIGGVRRIWANNELIYSVAEDADLATIQASNNAAGNIKIYTGSETQLPDPTLEALHGAGNVPAYRGLAYIVISRIWVEKYGNRLPNFEFEVVGGVPAPLAIDVPSSLRLVPDDYWTTGSSDGFTAIGDIASAMNTTANAACSVLEVIRSRYMPYRDALPPPAFRTVLPLLSHERVLSKIVEETPTYVTYMRFRQYNSPCDGIINHTFVSNTGLVLCIKHSTGYFVKVPKNENPPVYFGFIATTTSTLVDRGMNVYNDFNPLPKTDITRPDHTIHTGTFSDVYLLYFSDKYIIITFNVYAGYENTRTVAICKIKNTASGLKLTSWVEIPRDVLFPVDMNVKLFGESGDWVYGRKVFFRSNPSPATWVQLIFRYNLSNLQYEQLLELEEPRIGGFQGFYYDNNLDRVIFYEVENYKDFRRWEVDVQTGVKNSGSWFTLRPSPLVLDNEGINVINGVLYLTYGRKWTGYQNYLVTDSTYRNTSPLRSILTDISEKVGVSPDVSEIPADLEVGGYAISRQISARGAIEPLQNAYFFDAVESDNGLKFIMRGGDKVATIIEGDMTAGIDQPADGDPAKVVRGQEVELPQAVSVSYADWNSDYQISSEMVQRQVTPSVNKVSTELPIAMSADQAARIADVWMYQAWSERTQLAFKVGAKHMKLEPTDVIEVQTAGQTFKARITGKTDDRGVIDISAVVDSGRYTSNATGSSNLGSQTNIAIQSPSLVLLLDSPIITDAEDDAGMYASLIPEAVLTNSVTWGGATLTMNEGGTSDVIHTVSSVGNPATCIGSVQAAVAKPVGRANIIDQSYTITVKTNGRPMDSISREQLFNHNNLFAVVNSQAGVVQELLQFQTAEETAEDTYRLSGILRGRFGTDSQIDAIAAGAYLVQLNPRNAILRVPGMPAQIGQEFAYKAVANGSTVENAQTVRYANTARGLKPYAPVRLNGRRVGNDWHLRWTRRSRIDGGWRNSVDVPLGEASEEYNLTIQSERVAVVSTPAFIYTEAMQIADFGSVRTSLTFTVAQVSAVVGAGILASWSSS